MGYWDSEGIFYHTEIYWKIVTETSGNTLYISHDYDTDYKEWLQSSSQPSYLHKITQEFNSEGEILSDSNGTIEYIKLENEIELPEVSSGLFSSCSNLKEFYNKSILNISKCKNLSRFFAHCSSLEYIDLCGFDFSSCTDISETFWGCTSLKGIICDDSLKHVYKNITTLRGTFSGCSILKLSGVQSATNFLQMFEFNNLTDVSYLFRGCCQGDHQTIDLSDVFPKSYEYGCKISDYSYMFYSCHNFDSIKLWEFSPEYQANITYLFADCTNLTTIYSKYNWSVEYNADVFNKCTDLPGFIEKGTSSDCCCSVINNGYFTIYEDVNRFVYFHYNKVMDSYSVYKNSTKWSSVIYQDEEWILEDS